MKVCSECKRERTELRRDGTCWACHVRSINFAFVGGGGYGRANWGTTQREFIAEHVGEDRIRSGEVERVR